MIYLGMRRDPTVTGNQADAWAHTSQLIGYLIGQFSGRKNDKGLGSSRL